MSADPCWVRSAKSVGSDLLSLSGVISSPPAKPAVSPAGSSELKALRVLIGEDRWSPLRLDCDLAGALRIRRPKAIPASMAPPTRIAGWAAGHNAHIFDDIGDRLLG